MLHHLRYVLLPAILSLGFVIPGLPQGLPPGNDQTKTYQLSGTVIDSVNERPIPRALVHLASPNRAMLTGPQGEFSFDGVAPGTAEIQVTKPGYFRPGTALGYAENRVDDTPNKVQVGPDASRAILKLVPAAVITGTVRGNDEEPLQAEIAVLLSRTVNGKRRLSRSRSVSSDQDGNFRIAGLHPGRYYLSVTVSESQWPRTTLGIQPQKTIETYPAIVYFPAGNDPAGATPLDLSPGQRQEANFNLRTAPAFRVVGVILNGQKKTDFVRLVDELMQPLLTADLLDPQSGAFEFRAVPAGTYWLQFGAETQDGRFVPNYRKLTVQSNITDLRLQAQALDVPIVVRKDFLKNTPLAVCTSGSPSGESQVSDCSEYAPVRLELDSLDFSPTAFFSDQGQLKTSLAVRGVAPGKYRVRATSLFGGYVQSVRCGALDLLREPLVVPDDVTRGPIEVVLRDDFATLRIQVRANKPGERKQVLIFADPLTDPQPQVRLNSLGNELYTSPLPPGAYKIFALDTSEAPSEPNFEEVEKYAAQAATVRVAANENASVVVDLIHVQE